MTFLRVTFVRVTFGRGTFVRVTFGRGTFDRVTFVRVTFVRVTFGRGTFDRGRLVRVTFVRGTRPNKGLGAANNLMMVTRFHTHPVVQTICTRFSGLSLGAFPWD